MFKTSLHNYFGGIIHQLDFLLWSGIFPKKKQVKLGTFCFAQIAKVTRKKVPWRCGGVLCLASGDVIGKKPCSSNVAWFNGSRMGSYCTAFKIWRKKSMKIQPSRKA